MIYGEIHAIDMEFKYLFAAFSLEYSFDVLVAFFFILIISSISYYMFNIYIFSKVIYRVYCFSNIKTIIGYGYNAK